MIMNKKNQKKGISTVIAAVFMVSIIVIGLNAVTWGLNLQQNFAQVMIDRSIAETEKSGEKIELRKVDIQDGKFNMTVINNGKLPVNLVNLWVTNMSDVNGWHKNYTLTDIINPGSSLIKLGQNLELTAKESDSYKITLVTERGTTTNFQISSPKDNAIKMNLFVVPRTVSIGQNVTVIFGVTNNATDSSIMQSITPQTLQLIPTDAQSGGTTPQAVLVEGPTPTSESSIALGESAFFKWIYKIDGQDKDKMIFNATLTGAKQGNYVMDSIDMVELSTASTVINQLTSTTGTLTMNFDSFQYCKPSTQDCISTSSNWAPGWKVSSGADEKYIFRVNMTNNANYDIYLENNAAMSLLRVQTGGAGGANIALFLKNDSTVSVEDGGAYTPNFSKKLVKNTNTLIYFGASAPASSTIQAISSSGIYTTSIVLFGYGDKDNSGAYETTSAYSQNIPFQGLCATDCN